jgi:hypothetical protein
MAARADLIASYGADRGAIVGIERVATHAQPSLLRMHECTC